MTEQILTGGFINHVARVNGHVVKNYMNDDIVSQKGDIRMRREAVSLLHFGNGKNIAPTLISSGNGQLVQEFIEGTVIENEHTEFDIYNAGKLLANVHRSVKRPFEYTRSYYEKQYSKSYEKAYPLLSTLSLSPEVSINWDSASEMGTTRVHRDFWMGNVIRTPDTYKAIDWEFSGIGSPYEDFSIADLWIFREYGGKDAFFTGYGKTPDSDTTKEFLKLKLIEFLGRTSKEDYELEDQDGFYHNKVEILKTLI